MAKWVMRVLGLLNLFFGVAGAWYYAINLRWNLQKLPAGPSMRDWVILSLLSLVELSMVCLVGYLGVKLMMGETKVLRFTAIVFLEIFWLPIPLLMAHSSMPLWEVGTGFIAPQIVTAYPLFGIIVCLLLLAGGPGPGKISKPR